MWQCDGGQGGGFLPLAYREGLLSEHISAGELEMDVLLAGDFFLVFEFMAAK